MVIAAGVLLSPLGAGAQTSTSATPTPAPPDITASDPSAATGTMATSTTDTPTTASPTTATPTTDGPASTPSTTAPPATTADTVPTAAPTTAEQSSTSAAPRQLAVSSVLGAPNPFDATQGFTVLARGDGALHGGTTFGAVAIGGDLSFGPYDVVPEPAAALDGTPVGLLVGGGVRTDDSTERLTVGAEAQLLLGEPDATSTVPVDDGVAVVPLGAGADAEPQVRVDGPQNVATVASPGTFEQAFQRAFPDLGVRARSLAELAPSVVLTDDSGDPIDDLSGADSADGADIHLAASGEAGPSVWSVDADDLASIDRVTIDPAPTSERPLVINVDGRGRAVRLDTPVTVSSASQAYVLWNVVDTPAVTVSEPLAGSLLAPTASATIDADVAGSLVVDTVTQTAGTVGRRPFSAALPETGETGAGSGGSTPSTDADPSSPDPDGATSVRAQIVPPATGTNAVITVKVGSDRTSTSGVGPLAGVTLQLYDGDNAPTTPVVGAFATCVSDADGDCSFVVPNTQQGGANRDRRFWVVRTGTPAGYFGSTSLITGASAPFTTTPYQFRTGSQLRAGTVYASSGTNASFMLATGNTNNTASGGIWQSSRGNPSLPPRCGLNVALVLDVSGSVAPSLPALKSAATTFTNSLVGTPSQVALFTFASVAPANTTNNQNRPITSVSTQTSADIVNGWINGLTAGGGTNWDRGLDQVAQSGTDFDVAIVVTDGNPTFYGNQEGPGNFTRLREVENGIFSANAVKAGGTRVIAFGVGAGVTGSAANLVSISGPTLNSDYYQTTDFAQAGTALRALALGSCQGTISVVKQEVPSTAPPGSITGAVPAGGWQFGATTTTSGVTIAPTSGTTAASTGAVNFDLTFPGGTTTAPVTITETAQPGFTLVQQAGLNATCRRLDTNAAVPVTNSGATGFVVAGATDFPVSCTVYNRAPAPAASVIVNKRWVINGQALDEGTQPTDFSAGLTIGGTPQGWGVERTGFQLGDATVLNESVALLRLQCTLVSNLVTLANGVTVSANLPFSATLAGGLNTYTITNTVTCVSRLTLVKEVRGTVAPTAWTLTATGPPGSLPGPSGATGVSATVTAGSRYVMSESGGDPRYLQRADPAAVPIPGSTVSWNCVEIDGGGTVIPGFSDGLNGGVTMPIGTFVRCTALNETAALKLIKEVVNDDGGTAQPSDWQLTATPAAPVAPGLTPVTVAGSTAGVTFEVRPGQDYALTETGPGGYDLTVNCTVELGAPQTRSTITLRAGELGTCTFTNNDRPARLTLTKVVDNGTTGAGAIPTNWTLAASGPTPISGTSGSAAVTDAVVNAGSYTLSESGGPAGYSASNWTCTGATPVGTTVVVPSGGDVRCTITNTAVAPRLTLVKQVENGTTGAAAEPSDWTLAAAGPTPLSGTSGTPAVSSVPVMVGTYTLSESGGPAGYTASPWTCTGATVTNGTLTLSAGQDATCTIVNTAVPPRLTLVKQASNTVGGTATADAWLLSAAGAVTIQGRVGEAAVTGAVVPVGAYTLAESGGPGGYTASPWTCTGASSTDPATATVTLAPGDNATCTITNSDQPAALTLTKVVDSAASGSGKVPADWTLTATPVAIAGQGAVSGNGDPTTPGGVNGVTVFSGSYDLSETGPAGFTPGTWLCQGGVVTGARVVVPPGGVVQCTITNTAVTPTLTLVKLVDNGSTGATAAATEWTLNAIGPTPISGTTGSAQVTAAPVQVGTYLLTESGPPGYAPSAWTCAGGSATTAASVTLAEGESATCTITNTAIAPRLTLVKVVENGTTGGAAVPTDWTLTASGPTTLSGQSGQPVVTDAIVQVGQYALSETAGPAGYEPSAWTCSGGIPGSGTITLAAGELATCTITNTALNPTLTLVKVVENGTTGGTATSEDWTLTAAGPTTVTGVSGTPAVTSVPVEAGVYDLSEQGGPLGYSASPWSCVGAPVTGTEVTIALDQDVTCTIINTAIPPQLTLEKVVSNSAGGNAKPTDWLLSASGAVTIQGRVGDAAVTGAEVPTGTYSLAESGGPGGYTASPWACTGATASDPDGGTVTLAPGDKATCTITNTDQPATLTLVKVVDPAASGSGKVPADWTLTATPVGIPGQGLVTGNGDPTSPGGVDAVPVFSGSYDLSESGPAGFTSGTWVCEGGVVTDVRVVVPSGGVVRCTITNTAVSPTLTLVKVVDNGTTGATTPATAWTLSAAGPTPISGTSGAPTVTAAPVQVGTYTLTESGPTGYTASDWMCTGASTATATSVSLTEGENATCTVTNTAMPPRLTLVKNVVNTSGGTALPTDWILSAIGPATVTGRTGETAVTDVEVPTGSYQLSETGGDAGYDASPWACAGNASPVSTGGALDVAVGEDITCTITNTDVPAALTLAKVVDAAGSGSGKVPADWTVTATPVAIAGQAPVSGNGDPTSPGGVSARVVLAGSYTLTESGPAGFTPGTWICEGGVVNGSTVVVPVHGTVICQITNQAVSPRLTLVKEVDNGTTGADAVPEDWTLSATGPTPISGPSGSAAVTDAAVHVGAYTLGESGPPGYVAGAWTCQGGEAVDGKIALVEGQVATCTVVNTAAPAVWELTKLADPAPGTSVDPGDTITYTLVAAHESGAPITGATASDDLTKVLPFATVDLPLSAGLTLTDTAMSWAIPTIPVGGSVQVSFSVTIRADAGGADVFNLATPTSSGGHCSPCDTTHAVRVNPVVTPTDPTTPPEQPGRPISIAGIEVSGPLRWAVLLLLLGGAMLVGSVVRLRRHPLDVA